MLSEDVVTVDLSVELSTLVIVTGEALDAVRDVKTAISSSLEGAEHTGSSGGTGKTDIEVAAEGTRLTILAFDVVLITIDVIVSSIDLIQFQALQEAASQQKACAISSGIVGQPDLDAVSGELMCVSGTDDSISLDLSVRYLTDDVFVGEANNHTVLGGVVLVLVLNTEAFAGIVVGSSLTTSPVLDLVPLEVLLSLDNLNKRHFEIFRRAE